MSHVIRFPSRKVGLPPGTAVYVGEQRAGTPAISVISYDEGRFDERTVENAEACREYVSTRNVTWINVTGIHDVKVLQQFGDVFGIHPLVTEDIANTGQRPRVEDHDDYLYIVAKMLYIGNTGKHVVAEQVSLILGRNYVLTFQEVEGDVFGLIRRRIREAQGRIRKMGCDYLAYSLLDAIVDHYFVVLENLGERIEEIQEAVLGQTDTETVRTIHWLKHEMILVRKSLWPMRELASALGKSESSLVNPDIGPYLRDVYEHTIHVLDNLDALRDMLTAALEIYMTAVSNRMNEIMKVLTVIATIFIPLTFIAGVYGMNFDRMPELHWRYGYTLAWLVMLLVGGGMALFFRRRKWL